MAEKEERILIARSTDYTISDTKDGALFEGKIAPHNANVYTPQEAINKISFALMMKGVDESDCKELSEAALNALLEAQYER